MHSLKARVDVYASEAAAKAGVSRLEYTCPICNPRVTSLRRHLNNGGLVTYAGRSDYEGGSQALLPTCGDNRGLESYPDLATKGELFDQFCSCNIN